MIHTFPKGICPKVNVIAQLEFELAYYDSAVQCFNYYSTRTPPFLALLRQPVLEKENWIQTSLKTVPHPAHGRGVQ